MLGMWRGLITSANLLTHDLPGSQTCFYVVTVTLKELDIVQKRTAFIVSSTCYSESYTKKLLTYIEASQVANMSGATIYIIVENHLLHLFLLLICLWLFLRSGNDPTLMYMFAAWSHAALKVQFLCNNWTNVTNVSTVACRFLLKSDHQVISTTCRTGFV